MAVAITGTIFFLAGSATAQDLEKEPGYLDVNKLEDWFDVEPRIEVNIKGSLLRLVAEASRYEDPELFSLLGRLRAIQVRGFDLGGENIGEVRRQAQDMGESLESDGWETIVRVREDDEQVHMYLRSEDDAIAGLIVMVVSDDEEEAVFVNIVGEIDPMQVGRLGRKFNIGRLDSDW